MDREELLLIKYGFNPDKGSRKEIRELIFNEIVNEKKLESHKCLRVLCFLLYLIGEKEDSELIWQAKMLNMDAGCMIEAELLCGAGYKETLCYLQSKSELEKIKNYIQKYVNPEINKDLVIDSYKSYYGIE